MWFSSQQKPRACARTTTERLNDPKTERTEPARLRRSHIEMPRRYSLMNQYNFTFIIIRSSFLSDPGPRTLSMLRFSTVVHSTAHLLISSLIFFYTTGLYTKKGFVLIFNGDRYSLMGVRILHVLLHVLSRCHFDIDDDVSLVSNK